MADDLEKRVEKLESRLDEHLTVIHSFIDELRADRTAQQQRMEQNERIILSLIRRQDTLEKSHETLVDTQNLILKILDRMDQKLDELGKQGKNGHS